MNLLDGQFVALTLMLEHNLVQSGWTFQYARQGSGRWILGRCMHATKTILVSAGYAGRATLDDFRDTVLHEIAHALAGPSHGHDQTWKDICIRIGARPERLYRPIEDPRMQEQITLLQHQQRTIESLTTGDEDLGVQEQAAQSSAN